MKNWSNQTNAEFYEKTPEEELRVHARNAGLDMGCDVELIFDDIQHCENLLVVGAGYGREVDQLLRRGYQGRLTLVEQSAYLARKLAENFSKNALISNHSIMDLRAGTTKFDAVLWFWSGISDFNKKEQQIIITKLSAVLNKGGRLYIDALIHDRKLANETASSGKTYVIENNYAVVYGYKPSETEIAEYARKAQFSTVHKQTYTTSTCKERNMYTLIL